MCKLLLNCNQEALVFLAAVYRGSPEIKDQNRSREHRCHVTIITTITSTNGAHQSPKGIQGDTWLGAC
jgi:hypothetical protein